MSILKRPQTAPHKIPLWAWHLSAWLKSGKKGPRPAKAPLKVPSWFWIWHLWLLARQQGKGSRAWKKYKKQQQQGTAGEKVAATAKHLAQLYGANMPYTETAARDDWLIAGKNPPAPPIDTDCSGFSTLCYWMNGLPDPNGLGYKWLGFTGTELTNAAKVGTITTDVSKARPGDIIVIGPDQGEHEVVCVEAGADPIVATHGGPGIQIQHLSVDPREPKRVCQVL